MIRLWSARLYRVIFIALVTWTGSSARAHADNWPQWRGPFLNGTSLEMELPSKWSREENIRWKLELPSLSASTPIVWEDRIFLNVADSKELQLWALDRNDGTVLWKGLLGDGNEKVNKQNMSSPSPVTDGTSVWVMTGTGVLKHFDFDGNEIWGRNFVKDYGKFGQMYGYGSSPLLHGDAVYVQVIQALLHGPEQIADLPVPVAESPGAVRIGHPERSHLVEYLAPNSVFNSLPRQRSSPHLRPDDRLVTIDRVLHHASLGVA